MSQVRSTPEPNGAPSAATGSLPGGTVADSGAASKANGPDKQLPEDKGLLAAQGAVQTFRTGQSMYSDKMVGAVGHNSGSIIINNATPDRNSDPSSFEDDLREVDEPPPVPEPLPFAPELLPRYLGTAREKRVLVIEHDSKHKQLAEVALHAIVRALQADLPGRKILSSGFDGLFPLHSLYLRTDWSDRVRSSVIFLYRSADDNAGQFFRSDTKTSMLRKQLTSMDAHLIVVVAAPAARTGSLSGALPHFWIFEDPKTAEASPDPLPATPDNFDALLLMCASWFPGLGPREFRALVNELLPAEAPAVKRPQTPPPTPTDVAATADPTAAAGATPHTAAPAPAPPRPTAPPPTRAERWRAGDVDGVLGELSIGVMLPGDGPGSIGAAGDAGYHLLDPAQRATATNWMMRRFPMLLVDQLDVLLARYFSPVPSQRFRTSVLNLLFRLDSAQIHRLAADWLLERFLAAVRQHPEASRHLIELLAASMDRSQGDALVQQVALGLAMRAREGEEWLLEQLPSAALAAAWQAATPSSEPEAGADADDNGPADDGGDDTDPSGRFWQALLDAELSSVQVAEVASLELTVARTLLQLCRHQPSGAVQALRSLLELRPFTGTTPDGRNLRIDRLSRVALRWELARLASEMPSVWLACADAAIVTEQADDQASGRPRRGNPPAWGRSSRALAADCLVSLVQAVSTSRDRPLPPAMHEILLGDNHRSRTASVLAKLLLGMLSNTDRAHEPAEHIDPDLVLWLFRSLASASLRREGSRPEHASLALQELAAPLRAGLMPDQRRMISESARATQEVLAMRRDIYERLEMRDELAEERRSLRAMQIVVRAFSGNLPAAQTAKTPSQA